MNTTLTTPNQALAADQLVMHHRRFRGLRVEQDLISQFTMYTVELEQLGLFISDSQAAAFAMAFEALFHRPQGLAT